MIDLALLDRLGDLTRTPYVITLEEVAALVRLARASRKCHPDTFVSTPDEVAEYIEAASAFTDSAEAK